MNVVRRAELVDELKAEGADVVLVEGEKISAGLPTIPQLILDTHGYCQGNFLPFLQGVMHYQIYQHFATEKLRGPVSPSPVGLAIVIQLFRLRESLNPDAFTSLKW